MNPPKIDRPRSDSEPSYSLNLSLHQSDELRHPLPPPVTPVKTPPIRSSANTDERLRKTIIELHLLSQIGALSLNHFREIKKSDLRRGDILLTHETEPSSDNHNSIQESQNRSDLNNVENNCGMNEIVHAGIILRDDVEAAENNHRDLGPKDHPYMSERGGIGTTNALRALGSAVPAGTSLVYRIVSKSIRHIFVEDAKVKEGVPYSSMEFGTSLRGSDFKLPRGLVDRNITSHIQAVYCDKDATEWANRVTIDHCSDASEKKYTALDYIAESENKRKKGPGAACSTFIVKGLQAAVGEAIIVKADAATVSDGRPRAELTRDEKVRLALRTFPSGLRIDAKRNAPKTLQHLLETVEIDEEKMFDRIGKLLVDKMAYPERRFNDKTGEEIVKPPVNVVDELQAPSVRAVIQRHNSL